MRLHSSIKLFDEPVNSLHFQKLNVAREGRPEIPLKRVK